MRDNLQVGKTFPDLQLPDHTGAVRRLSEVVDQPSFLNFSRGWWCPKEQRFFRNLLALQEEMDVAYTRVVSITVDPPEVTAPFRAGLGARWTFLSDSDRRVQQELDLEETSDTVHHPFLPYSFVLRTDLTITDVFNGYWYWGRPTNEEIRHALRAILSERADWDAQARR